jgi:hypothetical protein
MVKIGKTQLLMSDGTIRTFKSEAARDRFEDYVNRVIKHVDPQKIVRVKINKIRIKNPKLKLKFKPLRIKKIRARIK